jgi:hypothetical protein
MLREFVYHRTVVEVARHIVVVDVLELCVWLVNDGNEAK